jgi:hypothetical protein
MRKRTYVPLLIVGAVLAAFGIMAYLRAKAPPEAARLLPESDAILFLNLKTIRSATHFDQTPITRSAYFQHFIDATGIVPERDLDSAALALHRMPDPHGPNGPVGYSEVFTGSFDGVRLNQYLATLATSQELYAGRTIYTIPSENRQLRVAQLGYDTLAASNMPSPEQIHSMLDRARASALSTPGSSLLAARFHEVPMLSEAWGIGHIALPFSTPGSTDGNQPGYVNVLGLQLPVAADTDLVASLRYTRAARVLTGGAIHLRIEEFAPSYEKADHTAEDLDNLLGLLRGIVANQEAQPHDHTPADTALTSVLSSVKITQHDDRVLLNATIPLDDLKALTTSHNPTAATPNAQPASK